MSPRNARRRGSVLVEAAATVFCLLIPLMLGIIQFGVYYGATNVLSQASREGGRYAAVNWYKPGSDAIVKDYVIDVARQGNVALKASDITISPAGPRLPTVAYQKLTVTVNYNLGATLAKGGKMFIPIFNPGVVSRRYVVMAQPIPE